VRRLLKWVVGFVAAVVLVVATVIVLRAVAARRKPALKAWHRPLAGEFRAGDATPTTTLADYLAIEDRVMKELERDVYDAPLAPDDKNAANRYWRDSAIWPGRFRPDWNRTQQLEPEGEPRGGVLLIHGLTDSPYSVRALAEIYRRHGFYALCMRMPGHGTVPGALTTASWHDWRAAARIGVRHVRQRIGPNRPLHLVGYSNGGEIVTQYALDTLSDAALPKADRVVLLSPMTGVTSYTRLARGFAKAVVAVGAIPYFEKSRWLDILPEYIPYKYDSFPAYAGQQTTAATAVLQATALEAAKSGRIRSMPPILAFVSLVDSTVQTWATVDKLFARLTDNGSALVLFDLNRSSVVRAFLRTDYDDELKALWTDPARRYRLTLVTNTSPKSPEVVAISSAAGENGMEVSSIGLSWPPGIFSLSHLAVPFRPDDPLYGIDPDRSVDYGIRLGVIAPRGERGVLSVSADQFMRLNCNPFFPYLERRLEEWIGK
jgi:alpha-beta hydrolase superfamily lysophospholipase